MINFRFHIVSLTAVLLALGIGLALGTTFLDTATVDVLRGQLTDLEADLGSARERNERQQEVLDSYAEETEGLDQQIGERLFADQLSDVPVLVVAPRGMDEAQVEQARASLTQADARLVGTWWLTDRLVLDDSNEVSDLGDALQLSTDDVDRLRSNLAGQLGDVLFAAADSPRANAPDEAQGLVGAAPDQANQPAEPPLVARLHERGFVDYEMPEGVEGDTIELPAEGLRILMLSGPGASVRPSEVQMPVLFVLAESGPVPVVAAEPTVEAPSGDDDEEAPESLVVSIRQDDDLKQRVSTVDDLERVAGTVATVLALVDADPADPRVGHYGLGDGTRLLPPPPEAPE